MQYRLIQIILLFIAFEATAQAPVEIIDTTVHHTRFFSRVKGNVAYSYTKLLLSSDRQIDRHALNPNIEFTVKNDFYIRTNFYIDLTSIEKPIWVADYFYQVGVYNWRNRTFSYGYENYGPNRFKDSPKDFWVNFKRAQAFIKYKLEFSGLEIKPFNWDKTSKIMIEPFLRVQPEFTDDRLNTIGYGKLIPGLAVRYVIVKNIYIDGAVYAYPIKNSQLPWNPDYTYGFGVFNWRPWKVNFTYGNFVANRFPGRKLEMPGYNFWNGDFRLFINYVL